MICGLTFFLNDLVIADEFFCLDFHYHMYGSSMGDLFIGTVDSGVDTVIFSMSGDQGNIWHTAEVEIFTGPATSVMR